MNMGISPYGQRTVDLQTGATLTESASLYNVGRHGSTPISDDGVWLTYLNDANELVQRNTTTDTETVIAAPVWQFVVASRDGRYVGFTSNATGLTPDPDPNGPQYNAFVWDRVADTITRVSNPAVGDIGASTVQAGSDDLRYLLLQSYADLLGDADAATSGSYLYDRVNDTLERVGEVGLGTISPDGSTVYVALPSGELTMWTQASQTVTSVIVGNSSLGFNPQASYDGRYVTFKSFASDLVPGDTNGTWDLFTWDRTTDTLERVTGPAGITGWLATDWQMTDDGSVIAFASSDSDLTPGPDLNAHQIYRTMDVFFWHRADGSYERVTNGDVGIDDSLGISRDGSLVWFLRAGVHTWDRGATLPP